MVYNRFYSLTRVPDRESLQFYLSLAQEYMIDDPPTRAMISYDPPADFPVHIRDQMEAYIRDNPKGCYVIFT